MRPCPTFFVFFAENGVHTEWNIWKRGKLVIHHRTAWNFGCGHQIRLSNDALSRVSKFGFVDPESAIGCRFGDYLTNFDMLNVKISLSELNEREKVTNRSVDTNRKFSLTTKKKSLKPIFTISVMTKTTSSMSAQVRID